MSTSLTAVSSSTVDSDPGALTVDVLSPQGVATGTVDLPPEIFDVQVNIPLIHQVVVAQLAAARQGTHSTLGRGDVRGGGAKPYRQKGTGRARQGSIRAPHYTGGGVVHGPTPRDYAQRTPKKMKAGALRGALSDRARSGRIHVVSSFVEGEVPSTRTAVALLAGITQRRHVLAVIGREDVLAARSIRNADDVHLLFADQLNTYDVLVSDDVIFTEAALASFIAAALPASGGSLSSAVPVQPVQAQPVAAQPVAVQPVVVEPPAEPVVVEPAAEPVVVEPTEAQPVMAEPTVTALLDPGPADTAQAARDAETDAQSDAESDEVPK